MWFISRKSHDQVVDLLQGQIDDLKIEREFYRSAWTQKLGTAFPSPNVGVLATSPADSRPDVIPKADTYWTADDREIFTTWAAGNVIIGEDALEKWVSLYGSQPPMQIALSGIW